MENNSASINFTSLQPIDAAEMARGIVLAVLSVISAVGNTSALIFLIRRRRDHDSVFSLSLLNLCVADLITTSFRMGGVAVWTLTVVWLAGEAMCKIFKFFQVFGSNVSTHLITFISIDRALSICYPIDAISSGRKRVKRLLTAAWTASAFCGIPQLILFHLEEVVVDGVPTGYFECASTPQPSVYFGYSMFVCATSFVVPVLLMTISYSAIFIAIQKQSAQKLTSELSIRTVTDAPAAASASASASAPTPTSIADGAKDGSQQVSSQPSNKLRVAECNKNMLGTQRQPRSSATSTTVPDNRALLFQRARRRSSLTLFVVVVTFLVCWSPYYIMYLTFSIEHFVSWIYDLPPPSRRPIIDQLAYWLNLLTHLNTLINPLIYRSVPVDSLRRNKRNLVASNTRRINR